MVIIILLAAVVSVCVKLLTKDKVVEEQQKEEIEEKVSIDCEEKINLTDCSQPIFFSYNIQSNVEYTIKIEINNDVISIKNRYIYVNKVGNSEISIIVTTEKKEYTKKIIVEVVHQEIQANFSIFDKNNNEVKNLFVGEKYTLKITTNVDLPQFVLNYSENIQIEEIDKYLFNFTVVKYGKIEFNLQCLNENFEYSVICYEYISNFDLQFDHNTDKLYIFNQEYLEQANLDSKYSQIIFSVQPNENTQNNYEISLQGDSVELVDNKLIAKHKGTSTLVIQSLDDKKFTYTKTIEVEEVLITELQFSQNQITMNIGETSNLTYTFSPIYALTQLEISCDNNLTYSNGIITPKKSGKYSIKILDKLTNIFSICEVEVKEISNIQVIFSSAFLTDYNATFENDILIIQKLSETYDIFFSYIISGENIYTDINIKIQNLTTGEIMPYDKVSNSIMFTLSSIAEYKVTLTTSNSSYSFTIAIHYDEVQK